MKQVRQKNLWPLGILLIIVLGIILIVASVKIAMKQSIDTDRSFGAERNDVDVNINRIMSYQNGFEKFYTPYIGINKIPSFLPENIMKNPYYVTSVPKNYPQEENRLHKTENVLYIAFQENQNAIKMQNTPIIESVSLEITRLIQGDKKTTTIIIPMIKDTHDSQDLYKSETFSLPLDGYYQALFKVKVMFNETNLQSKESPNITNTTQQIKDSIPTKSSQDDREVYFSYWIFNGNSANETQK